MIGSSRAVQLFQSPADNLNVLSCRDRFDFDALRLCGSGAIPQRATRRRTVSPSHAEDRLMRLQTKRLPAARLKWCKLQCNEFMHDTCVMKMKKPRKSRSLEQVWEQVSELRSSDRSCWQMHCIAVSDILDVAGCGAAREQLLAAIQQPFEPILLLRYLRYGLSWRPLRDLALTCSIAD